MARKATKPQKKIEEKEPKPDRLSQHLLMAMPGFEPLKLSITQVQTQTGMGLQTLPAGHNLVVNHQGTITLIGVVEGSMSMNLVGAAFLLRTDNNAIVPPHPHQALTFGMGDPTTFIVTITLPAADFPQGTARTVDVYVRVGDGNPPARTAANWLLNMTLTRQ
jgi:hypothetical protein